MSHTPSPSSDATPEEHLELLVELLLDDALTEEQVAELNSIVADDPGAHNALKEARLLHTDLLNLFTTLPTPKPPVVGPTPIE